MPPSPRLSICIATFNRGRFIAQTLDSILAQVTPEVELVVVDGASPDDTPNVLAGYVDRSGVRYYREPTNSGVDADYEKAVGYATGTYCWLMTDDDLMEPRAVARVLAALEDGPALVIVNAQVWTADFSHVLMPRFLELDQSRDYEVGSQKFFAEIANYMTFIGGVVIRRERWLERERERYFGTAFIHVGVVFQAPPLRRIHVIAEPLVRIRYGNAMWSARGFEIWMFKWPALVWSFDYPDDAKAGITPRQPWRILRRLMYSRAIGSYSIAEYRRWVAGQFTWTARIQPWLVARLPGWVANAVAGFYCIFINRQARSSAYDLARSVHSTAISRLAARRMGLGHCPACRR